MNFYYKVAIIAMLLVKVIQSTFLSQIFSPSVNFFDTEGESKAVDSSIENKDERCFVAIKPDAVQRNLIGECISRFERKGLKVIGMKMILPSEAKVKEHYSEHSDKTFFKDIMAFFMSGPIVCLVCEGVDAIKLCRLIVGKTSPTEAAIGSIRGDYCSGKGRNLVHASDSLEAAKREIDIWFGDEKLLSYEKDVDKWVRQKYSF